MDIYVNNIDIKIIGEIRMQIEVQRRLHEQLEVLINLIILFFFLSLTEY